MRDKYIYGAGTDNSWTRTFVVENTLLGDTSGYLPPERRDFHLVPDKSASGLPPVAKAAGILGGFAALVFFATRNK